MTAPRHPNRFPANVADGVKMAGLVFLLGLLAAGVDWVAAARHAPAATKPPVTATVAARANAAARAPDPAAGRAYGPE